MISVQKICCWTDFAGCHPFKAYKCHNITHNHNQNNNSMTFDKKTKLYYGQGQQSLVKSSLVRSSPVFDLGKVLVVI